MQRQSKKAKQDIRYYISVVLLMATGISTIVGFILLLTAIFIIGSPPIIGDDSFTKAFPFVAWGLPMLTLGVLIFLSLTTS